MSSTNHGREVEKYIGNAKIKFETTFGKQIGYCATASITGGKYLRPWDCAIMGINKVSDGTDILGSIPFFNDAYNLFKSKPFRYAMEELKKIPNMVPYDFLRMNHRVFIGKKMAAYIRSHPYDN